MNVVLDRIRWLRERLRAREDDEHGQAILRIVILAIVLGCLAAAFHELSGSGHVATAGVGAALVLAVAQLVAICIWPGPSVARRVIGMVVDAVFISGALYLSGEVGVFIFFLYLFVAFGNGFRYGPAYLYAFQVLSLLGFSVVLWLAPWWHTHPTISFGLLVTLIILPMYVATLVKRIEAVTTKRIEARMRESKNVAGQ
jgi:two-component system, sensor histidine kinase RpfC